MIPLPDRKYFVAALRSTNNSFPRTLTTTPGIQYSCCGRRTPYALFHANVGTPYVRSYIRSTFHTKYIIAQAQVFRTVWCLWRACVLCFVPPYFELVLVVKGVFPRPFVNPSQPFQNALLSIRLWFLLAPRTTSYSVNKSLPQGQTVDQMEWSLTLEERKRALPHSPSATSASRTPSWFLFSGQ